MKELSLLDVYPISRYSGNYPDGEWEFVEEFTGKYQDALQRLRVLAIDQPNQRSVDVVYRIWDCR